MDLLLDTAPCGFIVFDDDGTIIEVNQTLASLLNHTKVNLVGKKMPELFSVAGKIFYQTHFYPLLKLHNKAEEIFLLLKGNNVEVPVLVNAVRKEGSGRFSVHCIMMPVHNRQKYESEILKAKKTAEDALQKNELLQQTQRELEGNKVILDRKITELQNFKNEHIELSSVISHDVQEPIRKIAIFADMIATEEHAVSKKAQGRLQKIKDSCDKMRNLIFSLDQYVAVGKDLEIELVNLNIIIDRVVQNAKLEYDIDAEIDVDMLPEVQGFKRQLEVLIYNLIDNAFKFREPSRRLKISIKGILIQHNRYKNSSQKYKFSDYLRISFNDNGIGFDNRYSGYVFKMFKKINMDIPGLGFGLTMCKKILDYHGGSIECHAVLGEGACFTVDLAISQ